MAESVCLIGYQTYKPEYGDICVNVIIQDGSQLYNFSGDFTSNAINQFNAQSTENLNLENANPEFSIQSCLDQNSGNQLTYGSLGAAIAWMPPGYTTSNETNESSFAKHENIPKELESNVDKEEKFEMVFDEIRQENNGSQTSRQGQNIEEIIAKLQFYHNPLIPSNFSVDQTSDNSNANHGFTNNENEHYETNLQTMSDELSTVSNANQFESSITDYQKSPEESARTFELFNSGFVYNDPAVAAPSQSHFNTRHCKELANELLTKNAKEQQYAAHSGGKSFTCGICRKKLNQNDELKLHMFVHKDGKFCLCIFCGKEFISKLNLLNHIRIHTGGTPFECDICKRTFKVKYHFHKHMLSHAASKRYKCNYCEIEYADVNEFIKHLRHQLSGSPYKCEKCDKSFPSITCWKYHISSHFKLTCSICQKEFRCYSRMQRHMVIHSKIKKSI